MTFNDVAKKIIKETISSAVFIDDRALESFRSKNRKYFDDHKRTINLFQDFKNNHCLLHPFKFTKKGWKDSKDFYLKNKDLLILDWQLVGDDHSYALKILEDAVWRKNLHFVCIYTNERPENVKSELVRYYTGKADETLKDEIREILSETSLNDYWNIDDEETDKVEFDGYIDNIMNARDADITEQIREFFNKYEIEDGISNRVKSIFPDDERISFSKFKSILHKSEREFAERTPEKLFIPSNTSSTTFYINHTIIKIFRKEAVQGDNLYEEFLNSFMQDQNKFLTLMGLEMRNRFRENSAFIGKDFTNLSEEAFFYHRTKNTDHPFIFNDYLIEILKDQVASFIHEKDLELFDVFEEYFQYIEGPKRIDAFKHQDNSEQFKNELFKLNYFYNRLNIYERKKSAFLRFGDVFSANIKIPDEKQEGQEKEITKYFICITPHCDCLRPNKIKNQYWFVEGEMFSSPLKSLDGADGRFLSFVKNEKEEIFVIDWTKNTGKFCVPFTMQIPNHQFNDSLNAIYYERKIKMKLIASIKENYAQRIANEATGYNYRIGIDFVKK